MNSVSCLGCRLFFIVLFLLLESFSSSNSHARDLTKRVTGVIRPAGLAAAADGTILVADPGALRIWRINGDRLEVVAGSGRGGYTGDGGPAEEARLLDLDEVAIDSSGNVYFTESRGTRVRKVNTSGILTTFAGTGEEEIRGDGGPAVNAGIGNVSGIAIDTKGNVFLSGMKGSIRKVDKNGIISTFIKEELNTPADMVFDDHDNLYVVEVMRSRVVKIDQSGNRITIAGDKVDKSAKLDLPRGITFDSQGNLLVIDSGNACLRRIERDRTITTVSSSKKGTPNLVEFRNPSGVAVGRDGTIYISDDALSIMTSDGKLKPIFVPKWPVQPIPNREAFIVELLDPEYTPATRLFDDYTEGSYHVDKLEVLNEIQKSAISQSRKLVGFLAVGPYGGLWSYDLIAFFVEGNNVRANRLIMPHARITWKGTALLTMKEFTDMMDSLRSTGVLRSKQSTPKSTSVDDPEWKFTVLMADWSSTRPIIRYAALDFFTESSETKNFLKVFDRFDKIFQQTY